MPKVDFTYNTQYIGCSKSFSVHHVLNFQRVGLFIAHHNDVNGKLIHLANCDFSLNWIYVTPIINQGRSRSNEEVHQDREENYNRGDFIIRGLWELQTNTIVDVIFGDANCVTYNKEPIISLLARWVKGENDKQSMHCHNQWKKHFVSSLHWQDSWGRVPGPTQVIYLTRGRETGRTSFPRARLNLQKNCYSSCTIVLAHDSQCLPTQSF